MPGPFDPGYPTPAYFRLYEVLRHKHVTQRQLARMLDADQSYVSKLVSGKVQPSWQRAVRLAEILGCPLDWFWRGPPKEDEAEKPRPAAAGDGKKAAASRAPGPRRRRGPGADQKR